VRKKEIQPKFQVGVKSYRNLLLPGALTIDTSAILVTSSFQSTAKIDADQPTEATITTEGEIPPSDLHAVLSGGSFNKSSAYHTTVGGGYLNTAQTAYGTVSGGRENIASGLYTTVGGGYANEASGRDAAFLVVAVTPPVITTPQLPGVFVIKQVPVILPSPGEVIIRPANPMPQWEVELKTKPPVQVQWLAEVPVIPLAKTFQA
jgi:hypothetical protein